MWSWILTSFAAPPTATDLLELRRPGALRLEANGAEVHFATSGWRFDPDATPLGDSQAGWSWHSETHALDLTTGASRPTGAQEGWSYATGPGGALAWVGRDGEGGAALFIAAAEGTRQLDLAGAWPSEIRWDPTGEAIYFLGKTPATEAEREAAWWSDGVQEHDAPRRAVRVQRVERSTGAITAVTPEHLHVEDFAVNPRTGALVVATAATGRDYDAYFMARLQEVGPDGALTPLTDPGCAYQPTFSPDGASLAWMGCGGGILVDQLFVRRDGETSEVLAGADVTVDGYDWTERGLLVWTRQGPRTGALLIGRKGRRTPVALPPVALGARAVHPSGRWAVVVVKSPSHPGRLGRLDLLTGALEERYDPNPAWNQAELATTEIVRWIAEDGTELEGLLHRPPAGVPVRGLLVNPHGGPESASALEFSNGYHHAFAGAGYAVFQPNYRGGVGYGRAFYEASRGRIADLPFADIEAGVDHLVATGFDPNALFYGGWSYGGYLSAWTLGHTDRYRAIVSGGTISSTLVQYSMSSNTGRRADFVYGGPPWTHQEAWDRQDPIRFLEHARTPTLLFHGEDDDATPLPHALILHRALRDLDVPTELYVFPDERHGNFSPARERFVVERWIAWMDLHGAAPR